MNGEHGSTRPIPGPDASADLVAAALARAELHSARTPAPVPFWTLLEHLAIPRRSHLARRVQVRLSELAGDGRVELGARRGVPVFSTTDAGARRLQRLRRRGAVPALPESPQHVRWRLARADATQEIDRMRRELRAALTAGECLLTADAAVSDDWFSLGARLRRECRRLGAAVHILREWEEPSEARADIDDLLAPGEEALGEDQRARRRAARAGRRNTRLWR